MNRFASLTLAAGALLAIAPTAVMADTQYAWARVLDVQPVTRVVRTEVPYRECRTEEVTRETRGGSAGSVLAGALIGGVVGNQIGSGNGRRAATAAGVLIGSGIGAQSASTPRTTVEERCELYTEIREEERPDGYRVTYEYGGSAYVTRTARDPGDRIRVQVSVRPASF